MTLGGLYQRLLVAAGAVALLVVNWFCQPTRRRPLPPQQGQVAEGTLQEALLQADNAAEYEETTEETRTHENNACGAQLSQPESTQQLRNDAPVAPEEVLVQPMDSDRADPSPPAGAVPEPRALPSAIGTQPHQPAAPAASPLAPPAAVAPPDVLDKAVPAPSNPVDEDYLKSLLDQEFGPPKFAVPKQSAGGSAKPPQNPPGSEELSLQQLLDQAFGPPKFAVPKQLSPPAQPDELATATAEALTAAFSAAKRAQSPPPQQQQQQRGGPGSMEVDGAPRSGMKRVLQEEVEEGGFVALTLTVTHGPAAGKVFVADNPAAEYKIGRLPDCSLQILDQEISGRHASLRWDPVDRQWKLHDVGSLNGTTVAGTAIGRDYKVPGPEHPLADGDTVVLGSVSRLSVRLSAAAPAAAAAAVGAAIAKRHHTGSLDSGAELSGGSLHERNNSETLSGVAGLQGGLPAPAALRDFPELGLRLCVHNQLGVDHKRMGQGCEDVPYWELPYEPYSGAGLLCVFDGHHGSKAANQAREHLPAVLRSRLLRRDGRAGPPLPPPPPPPQRLAEEEEEESLDGGDQDLGEEEDEQQGQEQNGEEEHEAEAEEEGPKEGDSGGTTRADKAGEGGATKAAGGGKGPAAESAAAAAAGGGAAAGSNAAAPAAAVDEEEALPPEELLPPPPEGPPLPALLRDRKLQSQQALLKETFLQTDQYLSMEEGCTATVVLLEADAERGWTMQSANVGDSSAVLVNFTKGTWTKLSEDHRIASSVSERERLAARGHTVRTRLYGLNISRMLGDRFLKEEDLGFLAEPYVGPQAQVDPDDYAVLVVASDGLWDVLPEERAARLLLQEASRSASSAQLGLPPASASAASQYGTLAAGTAPPQPPPPMLARVPSSSGASASSSRPPSATLPIAGLFLGAGGGGGGGGALPPLGCQAVADLLLTQALVLRSKDDITVSVLEMGPHLRPEGGGPVAGC